MEKVRIFGRIGMVNFMDERYPELRYLCKNEEEFYNKFINPFFVNIPIMGIKFVLQMKECLVPGFESESEPVMMQLFNIEMN